MRWSRAFIPTLKEDPQEAEAISHKLMVRAGLIRRLTAGAYTYLPMGYKVLRKAKEIIRQEMNSSGATELLMPALQPPELWKKTGRYDVIGDVMIKFKDRHGKEIALGPTHEEVITNIISKEVRSYKDLPLILYQIQNKFRDELRPRFGVVRSCEFTMKDAYSFDVDAEAMEKSYKAMYDAYCRIFERCGLPYIAVEADSGLMGGTGSHEFMVPSEIGEDQIIICSACGYAASTEVAAIGEPEGTLENSAKTDKMEEVNTPGVRTVEEVSDFLKAKKKDLIKTLIYVTGDEVVAVLLRGDHEANEAKIKNHLKVDAIELATEDKVKETTGGPMGFSGPIGLKVRIIADNAVKVMTYAIVGANKQDTHLRNIDPGKDFSVNEWADLRTISECDVCPKCGGNIEIKQAIEIGHTFKLGTKYTKPLNATFLDEKGKEQDIVMGCYGIGVNRILASLIENSYDENGIIWPVSFSPCDVVIVPVKKSDKELWSEAVRIYKELTRDGVDVLLDDREKSPGVKFKDADLVGFPVQIVIGKKSLAEGKIEVKIRATGEKQLIDKNDVVDHIKKTINNG